MLLKHRANWTAVCAAIVQLPCRSTWSVDNPVERLNLQLSLLVEGFVPTMVIHVHIKGKLRFNGDSRHAFDLKLVAHHPWSRDRSQVNWDEFVHYQRRTNEVYAEVWGGVPTTGMPSVPISGGPS